MTTLVSAFYLNIAESFNVKINIYIYIAQVNASPNNDR